MAFVTDVVTCLNFINEIVNFARDLKENYQGKSKFRFTPQNCCL
jgi:hypothetical protein